ncbi:hypothetical protein BD413DRAFT_81075 [Trametes elegans]|nr:hypothetical protein BD413DRAFT_81075 [Trametes elegans]
MRAPQPLTDALVARNTVWARAVLAQHSSMEQRNSQDTTSTNTTPAPLTEQGGTHSEEGGGLGQDIGSTTVSAITVDAREAISDKGITGIRRLERRVVDLHTGVLNHIGDVKAQLSALQLAMSTVVSPLGPQERAAPHTASLCTPSSAPRTASSGPLPPMCSPFASNSNTDLGHVTTSARAAATSLDIGSVEILPRA